VESVDVELNVFEILRNVVQRHLRASAPEINPNLLWRSLFVFVHRKQEIPLTLCAGHDMKSNDGFMVHANGNPQSSPLSVAHHPKSLFGATRRRSLLVIHSINELFGKWP
jgi:hypothetical protein